jgi:hypothetical protein
MIVLAELRREYIAEGRLRMPEMAAVIFWLRSLGTVEAKGAQRIADH